MGYKFTTKRLQIDAQLSNALIDDVRRQPGKKVLDQFVLPWMPEDHAVDGQGTTQMDEAVGIAAQGQDWHVPIDRRPRLAGKNPKGDQLARVA